MKLSQYGYEFSPEMLAKYPAENRDEARLMVINRANEVLYDSRHPHELNVRTAIEREETRPLTDFELVAVNKQLTRIRQSIQYRCDNQIYTPYKNEIEMASTAVSRIAELIKRQPENENRREFANIGLSINGHNTANRDGNTNFTGPAGNNIAINGSATRPHANDDAFLPSVLCSRRTR